MRKDPDRYTYSDKKEIILVPQEYLEEEFLDVYENIPLSQKGIDEKAGEMWKKQPEISGGLIPDPDGKRIKEKEIIKTPKLLTKYRKVYVTRIFGICVDHTNIPYQEVQEVFEEITEDKGPLLIKAPNIKHPIDYFKNLIRNDVKTVKVRKASTIKKTRMIEKKELKVFKKKILV